MRRQVAVEFICDGAGHDDVVGGFGPFDLDVAAVIVDEGFAVGEVAAGGGDVIDADFTVIEPDRAQVPRPSGWTQD